ncbi:MAG TPA: ABC transporter permease [Proteiniphilum sp.]|nr:ABC transporter permease [Proteiniphilum sp.]HPJ50365.1 ABC transporter permease [Proteiniphilum sp.]HPR20284.1 ABC transporter permease [Proteiniphilum sp.]
MLATTIKLILRNWWRNKTFTLISLISLTVGIACFSMLFSFVVYEQGIEQQNPNRDRMVWVMQDLPSSPGEKMAYMRGGVPEQLMAKYPEVEDYLQLNSFIVKYIEVNNQRFDPVEIINVGSSFPTFFPFELLYGSWDALNNPQAMVISQKQAERLFGREDVIGEQLTVCEGGFDTDIRNTYTIGAVAKSRDQSAITFDGLICSPETNWGGPTLLMMPEKSDLKLFEEKVSNDQIPTLAGGSYYFIPLDKALSSRYQQRELGFWHHRKDNLLMVGLISALLLLLIAIFNYVNMSFSRLLQQVKMLQTQKLMGADRAALRLQILLDTLLTVLTSFLLALPLMHDLLPLFNQVVDADFTPSFFYSNGFFPVLILLLILLTLIPGWMVSWRISRSTEIEIRTFFISRRHRWVGAMVTLQFVISIALIIATITVYKQSALVKKHSARYHDLIEIGMTGGNLDLRESAQQIRNISGVTDLSMGNMMLMNSWVMHATLKRESGEELQTMVLQLRGDENLIQMLGLRQLAGDPWERTSDNNPHSVFINQSFADRLQQTANEMVGEPLNKYLISNDSVSVIAGVVEDFYFASLEEQVIAVLIERIPAGTQKMTSMQIRLDGKEKHEAIAAIKRVWQQTYPDEHFSYIDIEDQFINRNRKIFEMRDLLQMYSLISILLTCFGLFGITFYAVKQRTKEIGIRKINGAQTSQIMWLLMKPMFIWMITAFLIAVPLAWWFMEKWLQQFAYRVNISVGSILLGLLFVACITFLTVGWHLWRTSKANPAQSLKKD